LLHERKIKQLTRRAQKPKVALEKICQQISDLLDIFTRNKSSCFFYIFTSGFHVVCLLVLLHCFHICLDNVNNTPNA